MAKVVTIELRANTQGAQQGLDAITQEIREQKQITVEFQRELFKLEQALKDTPTRALGAQKKLKNQIVAIKDAIKDQNISLKELNLERQAATQSAKTLTKGTADLTDQVASNYGVTGLLNTLTGGLASRFRDAYTAVIGFNKGLKGTKGALIATGIGAAVIAVGYLAANFDKVTEALGITNPKLQRFNEAMDNAEVAAMDASRGLESLRDIVLDTTADEKARTEALEKLSETVKGLNNVTLDQEDALQKVVDMTQPYIDATQKRAKADAFASLIAEEEANLIKERLETERQVNAFVGDSNYLNAIAVVGKAKLNIEYKKENEFITVLKDKYAELNVDALAAENTTRALNKSFEEQTEIIKTVTEAVEEDRIVKSLAQKAYEKDLIDNQFFIPGVGYVSKETFEELTARQNQARADEEQADKDAIAASEAAAKRKIQIEQEILDAKRKAVDLAIGLFGAETAAGKAALIAKQILAAQEMIQEARKTITFASLTGARASAAVTEGTAQTAKIGFPQNIPMLIAYALQAAGIISAISSAVGKSKNVASGLGAGGGVSVDTTAASTASSVSSVSAPSLPPQFSTVGASGVNQIASLLGDQPPVQAFVVSGDVTTAQELDRNIITSASIG